MAYGAWSDVRSCPGCGCLLVLWEYRSEGLRALRCGACGTSFRKSEGKYVEERLVSVSLDCASCGRLERTANAMDQAGTRSASALIPFWVPTVPFGRERPMWRAGHADLGIEAVADFYSPRNLWAL